MWKIIWANICHKKTLTISMYKDYGAIWSLMLFFAFHSDLWHHDKWRNAQVRAIWVMQYHFHYFWPHSLKSIVHEVFPMSNQHPCQSLSRSMAPTELMSKFSGKSHLTIQAGSIWFAVRNHKDSQSKLLKIVPIKQQDFEREAETNSMEPLQVYKFRLQTHTLITSLYPPRPQS